MQRCVQFDEQEDVKVIPIQRALFNAHLFEIPRQKQEYHNDSSILFDKKREEKIFMSKKRTT